jgi:hypothetical protein
VALAGIELYLIVGVFTVAVDDVFTVECVVLVERFVRSESLSIDRGRFLFAVSEQESGGQFVGGFRWDHVPLSSPTICENKHGSLSPSYEPCSHMSEPH